MRNISFDQCLREEALNKAKKVLSGEDDVDREARFGKGEAISYLLGMHLPPMAKQQPSFVTKDSIDILADIVSLVPQPTEEREFRTLKLQMCSAASQFLAELSENRATKKLFGPVPIKKINDALDAITVEEYNVFGEIDQMLLTTIFRDTMTVVKNCQQHTDFSFLDRAADERSRERV